MTSLILLTSNSLLNDANAIGKALGYGYPCFTVKLRHATSNAIFWACSLIASDAFIDWLNAGSQGQYPQIDGIAPNIVKSVFDNIIIKSSNELEQKQLFDLTLKEQKLVLA